MENTSSSISIITEALMKPRLKLEIILSVSDEDMHHMNHTICDSDELTNYIYEQFLQQFYFQWVSEIKDSKNIPIELIKKLSRENKTRLTSKNFGL